MTQYTVAALKLHGYLQSTHWQGQALIGPDPGVRFNYRIGRFLKSYLPPRHWNDAYCYLQAQSYWVLANWLLFARTGAENYRDIALGCSTYMLQRQRADGAWEYPNPEWKGRIATVEGIWAALGLLETYRWTREPQFLISAQRWYRFLVEEIGFQQYGAELAVNYFAYRGDGLRVPNNSADTLRFLAELADVTGDTTYMQRCPGLLAFIRAAQTPAGEIPYALPGVTFGTYRPHFQCYQYNAFQCLDLLRYYELTGESALLPVITHLLGFLHKGLAADGAAYYACGNKRRRVVYHTAVLGAAFLRASRLGIHGYAHLATGTYKRLLELQRPDGSFSYSRGDYYLLRDCRSYPRYLAMILYDLLLPADAVDPAARRGAVSAAVA
jgi:hypothetical protein